MEEPVASQTIVDDDDEDDDAKSNSMHCLNARRAEALCFILVKRKWKSKMMIKRRRGKAKFPKSKKKNDK